MQQITVFIFYYLLLNNKSIIFDVNYKLRAGLYIARKTRGAENILKAL